MFRSAAILQGADLANGFMGGRTDFANATLEDKKVGAKNIANAVKKYGANSEIPIVLHLDHGRDFDSCVAAIEGGYTSVMIDGSSLPYEAVSYTHLTLCWTMYLLRFSEWGQGEQPLQRDWDIRLQPL